MLWLIVSLWGEQVSMLNHEENSNNTTRFGRLELVDKEIFFIAFNRRDT